MNKYRCLVCGYIHIGEAPPNECPVCGVPASEFEIIETAGTEEKKNAADKHGEATEIVIIGGGIAGLTVAEETRKKLLTAKITIISEENTSPYYRINLTRYLAKEVGAKNLLIHDDKWYSENNIKLITGKKVSEISKNDKKILLEDGTEINYDKLVLATGANPFVPPIKGKGKKNVMTVRTLADADYILDLLDKTDSCICIGGGILGLEIAGGIAKSGTKVKVLEVAPWLMPRQLNPRGAEVFGRFLRSIGVEAHTNINVSEIAGIDECEAVELSTGERLETKLVVVTAGVSPNSELAKKAGLNVNKGILVNNRMQTSDDDIYAAGDAAEHEGVLYGLWNPSMYQAKVAGMNIAGTETEFGGIPRSSSLKVLGIDMFSIGDVNPSDESFILIDKEDGGNYYAFIMKEDKIAASLIIGDKDLANKVKQAVEKGAQFPKREFSSAESIIAQLRKQG